MLRERQKALLGGLELGELLGPGSFGKGYRGLQPSPLAMAAPSTCPIPPRGCMPDPPCCA